MSGPTAETHTPLSGVTGASVLETIAALNGKTFRFNGNLGGIAYQNATITVRANKVDFLSEDSAVSTYEFDSQGHYKAGRWLPTPKQAQDLIRWLQKQRT